jgi:hypothetical protein
MCIDFTPALFLDETAPNQPRWRHNYLRRQPTRLDGKIRIYFCLVAGF